MFCNAQADAAARQFLADLSARHRAAEVQAADEPYRIARRTKQNEYWLPDPVAADSAINRSVELGLPRVRDEVRNNPQFVNALSTLIDLIIGCGVQAYSDPFSIGLDFDDARLDFELNYAYESDAWFERWADSPQQCHVAGKLSWWDIQRLAFGEMPEVGDAILLRVNKSEHGRMIPFCVQVIEREQLDRTKDRPAGPKQNKIVNGIELDAYDQPVVYHIFDAHPDDGDYISGILQKSRPIPASRVIHSFIPFRPSQHVGFSWFAAMSPNARARHLLMGDYLTKAAVDALLCLIHYKKDMRSEDISLEGEERVGRDGNTDVVLARGGQSLAIPVGDDVKMFQSGNNPPQSLTSFIDVLDHDGAAAIGLSHLRYSKRWASLSYTAGRGAQLDDEMHVKPLRRFFGSQVVLPVRQQVNRQMVALGRITSLSASEFERDQWQYNNHLIVGPGREQLDPEGESDSAKSKLGAGLSTLQIELGKLGLHWVKVLRQIKLENKVMEKLGVVLDFSKGGGQQMGTRVAGESKAETKERMKALQSAVADAFKKAMAA